MLCTSPDVVYGVPPGRAVAGPPHPNLGALKTMTPKRFALLREALARRQPTLTVLMENVHKPHNYSAILRSCDAVGALGAHAITSPAAAWKDKAVNRSPAGASAAQWVGVHIHDTIETAVDAIHESGHQIVAAHPSAKSRDFRDIDYTIPTAIMVGTELHGLTDTAIALADAHITIPMLGLVESLNVSVATAIVLFEAQRQRRKAGMYEEPKLSEETFDHLLFEWAYPKIADLCRRRGQPYPSLDELGEILGEVPR